MPSYIPARLAGLIALCLGAAVSAETVTYQYRIVDRFPHDTAVFTQGLVYANQRLYESAGQYGESRLLVRTLADTTPLQQYRLDDQLFAEGLTLFRDKLYQLSWRSGRGFIYDANSLAPLGEFPISGEGWGLTDNGQQLIVSDGSATLQFLDPDDFSVVKKLTVTLNGSPIPRLNELEWIDGAIYANIWQSNWLIIINPETGKVEGKVRLHDLLPPALRTARTNVLNGIAYDREQRRLLVTGKYWPLVYHIELIAEGQ